MTRMNSAAFTLAEHRSEYRWRSPRRSRRCKSTHPEDDMKSGRRAPHLLMVAWIGSRPAWLAPRPDAHLEVAILTIAIETGSQDKRLVMTTPPAARGDSEFASRLCSWTVGFLTSASSRQRPALRQGMIGARWLLVSHPVPADDPYANRGHLLVFVVLLRIGSW